MNSSDSFRAGRIAWRFKKSGANGGALVAAADMDVESRARLASVACVREPEELAVGLLRSESDWVLISSRRVAWTNGGDQCEVSLSAIRDATIDDSDLALAGGKDRVEVLTVVTINGERLRLALEPGAPLVGVWNALKMVAGWNRRPEEAR